LPHFEPASDPVYICLSPDQVVVHPVVLPLAAEENLSQVLEYEIQRLLPFRLEGLYYDYLSVGRTKDKRSAEDATRQGLGWNGFHWFVNRPLAFCCHHEFFCDRNAYVEVFHYARRFLHINEFHYIRVIVSQYPHVCAPSSTTLFYDISTFIENLHESAWSAANAFSSKNTTSF